MKLSRVVLWCVYITITVGVSLRDDPIVGETITYLDGVWAASGVDNHKVCAFQSDTDYKAGQGGGDGQMVPGVMSSAACGELCKQDSTLFDFLVYFALANKKPKNKDSLFGSLIFNFYSFPSFITLKGNHRVFKCFLYIIFPLMCRLVCGIRVVCTRVRV